MQKRLFLILCPFLIAFSLVAQSQGKPKANDGRVLLLDINYGVALPGGDLKDRFGYNFDVGLGFEMVTKDNWIFGLGSGFIFGNRVKEDVLRNLKTSENAIIGSNGIWAAIELRERGFHMEGRIGKLIPLAKDNNRSGLRLTLGLGFLQHKIRLQEDPNSFVYQIRDGYEKGYDQLSNGLMINQFIGYQHLSKNRLINCYAGFEFSQAFTKNRRDFDFITQGTSDKSTRLDLLYGFKIGWILPFYISTEYAENIKY